MKRILIVDDEAEICSLLKDEFESLGWQVEYSLDSQSAFEKVRAENFDVILSDIRMPGGGGLEILRSLREERALLPVVFLVTGDPDSSVEEALALGARGVIAKPFSLSDLVGTILHS